jgi:hypothetical protein
VEGESHAISDGGGKITGVESKKKETSQVLPRLALLYRRKLREHLSIWRLEPGWAACALPVLTNIKILTEFGVTIQFLCTVKLMVTK